MKNTKSIKKVLSLLLIMAIAVVYAPFAAAPAYADDGLTLEIIGGTSFIEGDPVYVRASGDSSGQQKAWVGLYRKGEVPGGPLSLRWYYVGAHEGQEVNILDSYYKGDRSETLRPGDYTVFLCINDGYDVVDSIDFTITEDPNKKPASRDDLKMELAGGKSSFVEGEPVYVKASGDPDDTLQAWVGLYKKGEEPGSGIYSLRWYYVSAHEGQQVDIVDKAMEGDRHESIRPGEYTVYLFGNNDYDVVKSIDFTVTEDPDKEPAQPSDELTLRLTDPEKTTYKVGEEVWIMATGTAEGAWVGLYKESEVPAESTPSLRWYYLSDGYNGVKVDIMSNEFIVNNSSPITEGDYKILLFDADNYDNIVKELHIKVEGIVDIDPDEFTIETDKTEYAYKEQIKVKATGTGIGGGAWVGLYSADTTEYSGSYLYYYYVKENNGNWAVIQNQHKGSAAGQYVGDGKYKLVIFADGGYSFPVKWVEITVVRDLKYRKVLRDPGCTTYGVEYVTYEDDTSEYREIPTLGGHIWGKPVVVEGQAVHKFVCERDEEHVKTEGCISTTGGTVTKAATVDSAGTMEYVCDVCGGKFTTEIPKLAAEPALSKTVFTYNGKAKKPKVETIKDSAGNEISSSLYKVTYPKKSYRVGTHTVTVKFRDKYEGTYKLTYKVKPKKVTFRKLTKGKKSFTVRWSKAKYQTTGYQIAYSTGSSFKNVKYKKIKGIKRTKGKVTKLKGGKKYYVKVRAYKVVKGKTYYSAWSTVKTVRTKK